VQNILFNTSEKERYATPAGMTLVACI